MKKVVFIDHECGSSGSTISLKYIIAYFIQAGISVSVITPKPPKLQKIFSDLGAACFPVENSKYEPLFLDLHFSSGLSFFSKSGLRAVKKQFFSMISGISLVHKMLRTVKPDLIYINEYVSIHAGIAAKLLRIPVVMHVRSLYAAGTLGIRAFFLRKTAKYICNAIIAITGIEAGQFKNISAKKINIIGEFLDESNFAEASDVRPLRHNFHIIDNSPVVVMLGGIIDFKGTYPFLQAAEIVLSKKTDIVFIIAGLEAGPEEFIMQCKSFPSSHNLQKNIFFLNVIPNPIDLLSIADILVSPTLLTHFSRPVIEAWALKKAVIATETLHSKNLISHGENGFLIKIGDTVALAQAVEILLNDPDLRRKLGEAGHAKARKEFDSVKNTGRIFEICQSASTST